jgi:hypothetical protein
VSRSLPFVGITAAGGVDSLVAVGVEVGIVEDRAGAVGYDAGGGEREMPADLHNSAKLLTPLRPTRFEPSLCRSPSKAYRPPLLRVDFKPQSAQDAQRMRQKSMTLL